MLTENTDVWLKISDFFIALSKNDDAISFLATILSAIGGCLGIRFLQKKWAEQHN